MKTEIVLYDLKSYSMPELIQLSHKFNIKYVDKMDKENEYSLETVTNYNELYNREIPIVVKQNNIHKVEISRFDKRIQIINFESIKFPERAIAEAGIIGNVYLFNYTNYKLNDKCDFNIHLDGEYLKTVSNTCGFGKLKLENNGLYYYRLVVYHDSKKVYFDVSHTYEYFSDQYKKRVREILKSIKTKDTKLPTFYPSKVPFQDICLLFDKRNKSSRMMSSVVPQVMNDGSIVWFSGIMKLGEKLVCSPEEMNLNNSDEIKDNIGCYFAIVKNNEGYEIVNDFFGLEKIFYYDDNDYFVCSNRVHYLLLKLKQLNIPLSLNEYICLCGFSNAYAHFAENPITNELDINNMYFLDIGQYFSINKGKIEKKEKEIANLLYDKRKLDYSVEIKKVKNEIINNLEIVVRDARFKNIAMDLSGGMDSRLVFGAATNLPGGGTERIKIRTIAYPNIEDFNIGTTIADDFNFNYDFEIGKDLVCTEQNMKHSLETILEISDSTQIGTYFGFSDIFAPMVTSNDNLEIWGVMGEAITRPYISGRIIEQQSGQMVENDEEFLHMFWNENQRYVLADFDKAGYILEKIMLQQMKKVKYNVSAHKFETLYLKYRNRFHGDIGLLRGYRTLQWQPLQSKTSLRLFHNLFDVNHSNKYVFDLLYEFDSQLVNYPFSSQKYNEDKMGLKKEFNFTFGETKEISKHSINYETCYEKYRKSIGITDTALLNLNFFAYKNINNLDIYLLYRMLPYLKIVLSYKSGEFCDAFGYSIWHICEKILYGNRSPMTIRKFRVIYRKIISLANEINIVLASNEADFQ